MRTLKASLFGLAASVFLVPSLDAQQPLTPAQAVDRIVAQEQAEMQSLRAYSPIIETYIQMVRPNKDLGAVPDGDKYFLGRAVLARGVEIEPLVRKSGVKRKLFGGFREMFSAQFLPEGFLQMIYLDTNGFDRQHYNFQYARREFLGDVRCLVFNVTPLPRSGKWRFAGRIWVEDQGYHIVRFNGIYGGSTATSYFFSFDSWRVNAGNNQWVPAFIYTEQGDVYHAVTNGAKFPAFKAQTRLWGYNLGQLAREQELSRVLVESSSPIQDQAESAKDYSPVEAERAWDRQGEDNVAAKMQELGLLAAYGEVDKMLETVVNNLEVTNDLDVEPEIRCRVLMTSTFESFTIGHTIVLSRGLVDVLPDEASLAAILAHELSHVLLGRRTDSRFSFYSNMLFDEKDVFRHFGFARLPEEEQAANQKGIALLKNSPYKDQLQAAQNFLRSLQQRSREIPNLISPHLGGGIPAAWTMASSAQSATPPTINSVPALPLGGRIKVEPWNDQLRMLKSKQVASVADYERAPFGITPFLIHLARQSEGPAIETPDTAAAESTGVVKP